MKTHLPGPNPIPFAVTCFQTRPAKASDSRSSLTDQLLPDFSFLFLTSPFFADLKYSCRIRSFHFWFTFAEDLISMASSALAYPSDFQIPFDLFISKKHPGLPRGYLGLADSSGTIVYRVNRRSPKHNRVLLDAAGNPLISMRGSHVSLSPSFPCLFPRKFFSRKYK